MFRVRAANLDSTVISNIRNGRREIGIETAVALAKATHRKPESILHMAGKLPGAADEDPWAEQMAHKLALLPSNLRNVITRVINSMLDGEESEQTKTKSKPTTKSKK